MKNALNKAFPFIIIAAFLFYWIIVIILAMPSTPAKKIIAGKMPRFRELFSSSWKLFTPPLTYNNRLYFIISDPDGRVKPDSIEILADLSKQKQDRAPFNQKENIIDHLVQNTVIWMTTVMLGNKNFRQPAVNDSTASYVPDALAKLKTNGNYLRHLATLNNYCKLTLTEKKIVTTGKKVKIVITQKMKTPFEEMNDRNFIQKEVQVFEADYKSLP